MLISTTSTVNMLFSSNRYKDGQISYEFLLSVQSFSVFSEKKVEFIYAEFRSQIYKGSFLNSK